MEEKPIPEVLQATIPTVLRYRGVWPLDSQSPIWFATTDCILRLLCTNVTAPFAMSRIAYGLERRINLAHERHAARWQLIAEGERVAQRRLEGASREVVEHYNQQQRERVRIALEGDPMPLTKAEVLLLRSAIEVCTDPEAYADETRRLTAVHMRWYMPILQVLQGFEVDTTDPAPVIPPDPLGVG